MTVLHTAHSYWSNPERKESIKTGGEKPWNYPTNLKNCFSPPLLQDKVGKILDNYIQDYKIHVFDIPRLPKETVAKFQSDFKVVAEYFTNAYTNPAYVPDPHVIRHVDEFLKLMKVLTGDNRYETMMFSEEEKKEGIDVCKVLDYREARGEARGLERGIAQGITQGITQGISQGIPQGIARMNALTKLLLEENRLEELQQVVANEKLREEYLVRYGI